MIHVSERAAEKIRELLGEGGVPAESGGLRVGVQGGGCSGLSYAMRLDTEARNRDKVFEENGARIFVDPKSSFYPPNPGLYGREEGLGLCFVPPPRGGGRCGGWFFFFPPCFGHQ